VEILASDPAITRVYQLSARTGTSTRSLQRLFREYVGVSPE
jgi:transcriptional regulator GlxA family with amidase domain